MALTAVRVWPTGALQAPADGGLFREVWRYTGDGADATIDLTSETFTKVFFAEPNGATHNIPATAGSFLPTVTFTFAAAPGNGLIGDIVLYGTF